MKRNVVPEDLVTPAGDKQLITNAISNSHNEKILPSPSSDGAVICNMSGENNGTTGETGDSA